MTINYSAYNHSDDVLWLHWTQSWVSIIIDDFQSWACDSSPWCFIHQVS